MISKLLKKNEKGFTLMEMLIVVAIIAVLVAIAIPTFNSSLNKAKKATDEANVRAGYAAVMMKVLEASMDTTSTNTVADGTVFYLLKDGTVDTTKTNVTADKAYTCQFTGEESAAGQTFTTTADNKYFTYTYTESTGKVEIKTASSLPTT